MPDPNIPLISFITLLNRHYSGYPPFGYLSLATYLNKLGQAETEIVQFKTDLLSENGAFDVKSTKMRQRYYDLVLNHLNKSRPKYIGIGGFTNDYYDMIELGYKIKESRRFDDVIIIAGNVHASLFPEDFIFPKSPFDYVVMGEGEISLTNLIEHIENEKDVSNVKGVAYLDGNKMFKTAPQPLVEDLDSIPIFDYSKIDMALNPRIGMIRWVAAKGTGIYTGRGCPFKCAFCASNSVWNCNDLKGKTSLRFRSIEKVIEEIKFLKKQYGLEAFYIMDDTFTLKRKRVEEFCESIKPLNLMWAAETRVGLIDDSLVKLMKNAGCIQLDFGVETASQRMLDTIKKQQTAKEASKAFQVCRKNNVRTFANFLINLPGENENDIKDSLNWLKENRPDVITVAITTPYPGTEIYDKYLDQKPTNKEYQLFESREYIERFKMASHNLDFYMVQTSMTNYAPIIPCTLRVLRLKRYLLYLLDSKDKLGHLKLIFKYGLNMLPRQIAKRLLPKSVVQVIRKTLASKRKIKALSVSKAILAKYIDGKNNR